MLKLKSIFCLKAEKNVKLDWMHLEITFIIYYKLKLKRKKIKPVCIKLWFIVSDQSKILMLGISSTYLLNSFREGEPDSANCLIRRLRLLGYVLRVSDRCSTLLQDSISHFDGLKKKLNFYTYLYNINRCWRYNVGYHSRRNST